MSLKLKCVAGPLRGQTIEVTEARGLVLGREPQGDQEETRVLPSKTVSRSHCKIEFDSGEFKIIDLRSSNGIRINRKKSSASSLRAGDLVEIGEFSFSVEIEGSQKTGHSKTNRKSPTSQDLSAASPRAKAARAGEALIQKLELKRRGAELREKFERLDFPIKVMSYVVVAAFVGHWLAATSFIADSSKSLSEQSFETARELVKNLGDSNRSFMGEASPVLLDCNFVRKTLGVVEAYILDAQGRVICPISAKLDEDNLTRSALQNSEATDNCRLRILDHGLSTCDLIFPIKNWSQEEGQFKTVGFSRLEYRPLRVEESLQNLQSLKWKTLLVLLGLLGGLWFLMRRWLQRAAINLTEGVHLAVTGNAQNLEKIESFAALDPLIDEINRLIAQGIQGVKASGGANPAEASFLQPLFQQVLVLEERPMLVVDHENQMIAATGALPGVIPIDVSDGQSHVTEFITDTHLQGELMSLLNDLSVSTTAIDRALSMSDRIVQVRGLPLVLNEVHIASILVFA